MAKPDDSSSETVRSFEKGEPAREKQDLADLAKQMFEAGKFGECLIVLEAAKAGANPKEDIERQKLIVQMHADAQRKDTWKILGLEKGASEAEVRASYKRLAQQVHPDKCHCFGAEQAFQILGEVVSAALGVSEGGFVKEAAQKEQHAWWDKWDLDPAFAKKKRKREQEPPPQTAEEELNLRTCPIEELKDEVAKRQTAVLRPEKGSAEAKLTAAQRQLRVRAARAVLNERLSYAQNAPKKRGAGGFL